MTHGTLREYRRGCRCLPCRSARAMEARAHRRGIKTPMVSATPVRRHLRRLSKLGIGSRQVAHTTGVRLWVVRMVAAGQRSHLPATVALLLREVVVPRSSGAVVSSWRAKKLLQALLREDWTLDQLARALQRSPRALKHLRPRIRVGCEQAIERLYVRLMGEVWSPSTLTYNDRD